MRYGWEVNREEAPRFRTGHRLFVLKVSFSRTAAFSRESANINKANQGEFRTGFPILDLRQGFFYTSKHKWGLYFAGFGIFCS